MAIADKLTQIANNVPLVYDAGYQKGIAEGGDNPIYYASRFDNTFGGVVFPENYDFVLRVKKAPIIASYMFNNCNYAPKTITLISDEEQTSAVEFTSAFNVSASSAIPKILEKVDISQYCRKIKITVSPNNMFSNQYNLKQIIGALDMSNVTATLNMFNQCRSLTDIEFVPNTIPVTFTIQYSTLLSKVSLQSIINGLSSTVTGQTVTLSLTAVNNAFDGGRDGTEWQALIATKPNWNIAYA